MRLGELCAGYNGLGMAVEAAFGATPAWFSEYDAAPSKILAHHYPDVPNYGDMTQIDWAGIEPVDIISGGTPCQDLSHAGRRAGMNEGTRSNLWVQMREAIAIQKPTYVVWENVRGAYSAEASSSVEQCPGCVGDTGDGRVFLRALGRVLGDLADLGYDAEWRGLRAADVGAPHGRFRVFVLAVRRETAHDARGFGGHQTVEHDGSGPQTHHRASFPHEPNRFPGWVGSFGSQPAADTESERRGEGWTEPAGILRGLHAPISGSPSAADPRSYGFHRGEEPDSEPETNREESQHRGHANGLRVAAPRLETRRHHTTPSGDAAATDAVRGGSGGRATEPEPARSDDEAIGPTSGADEHVRSLGGLNGNTSETGPGEVLPQLRGAARAETVRQTSRGPEHFSGSDGVQSGLCEHEGSGDPIRSSVPGASLPRTGMLNVWDDDWAARSPQGPQLGERRPNKPTNALRKLPPETPLERGPGATAGSQSLVEWGPYEPAIRRWERVLGRPAPRPTEPTGRDGGHRLSPALTEWMMGLPDGWVTDPAIGISRNDQLKACGNGVVVHQAYAALTDMLAAFQTQAVAA